MLTRSLIDYVSYTFHSPAVATSANWHIGQALAKDLPDYIERDQSYRPAPKRGGFDGGMNLDNHTFVFYNHSGLVLVEHTGQGCAILAQKGLLEQIVSNQALKLTRIDLALDIETETRPTEFVDCRTIKTQRASGRQVSDSGETCYVGSKKSDRSCKVYRYNPPHPRAHLLRIEYTYRGEQAREVQKLISEGKTVDELTKMSGMRYGWSHAAYTPEGDYDTIKAWRPDRKSGKTVRWLYSQAAPALAKCIQENAISLDEFIAYVRELNHEQD